MRKALQKKSRRKLAMQLWKKTQLKRPRRPQQGFRVLEPMTVTLTPSRKTHSRRKMISIMLTASWEKEEMDA
jgi:hypothetical protein